MLWDGRCRQGLGMRGEGQGMRLRLSRDEKTIEGKGGG